MSDQKIKGGYILLARKFLNSGIMEKPPLWSKLFVWMMCKANKAENYKGLAPGEFYTSIREMREAMTHYAGYRKISPTPKQIRSIYEGLSEGTAEGTAKGIGETIKVIPLKGNRGLRVTILNYKEYQDPKNYEGHKEKQPQKQDEGHSEKFTKDVCRAHLISKQEAYKKNKNICKHILPIMIDFVVNFIFYIQEEKSKFAPSLTKSLLDDSYKTIIDLCRIDGFEFEYIQSVIRWAKKDEDFWADNLQSLATLRKKSKTNSLKKFQNIARSYESDTKEKPAGKSKGGLNGKPKTQGYTKPDTRDSIIPERLPDYEAST